MNNGKQLPCVGMRVLEAEREYHAAALVQAGIKALPVQLPGARVPNGIITLKTRTLSPVAHHFIGCAREVAKKPEKRK